MGQAVTNQSLTNATATEPQRPTRVLWALTSTGLGGAPEQLLRVLPLMGPCGVEVHVAYMVHVAHVVWCVDLFSVTLISSLPGL